MVRFKATTFTPDFVLACVILPMVEFLLSYAAKFKTPDLMRTPATHGVYYSTFQAVLYIFCWFGSDLLQSQSL